MDYIGFIHGYCNTEQANISISTQMNSGGKENNTIQYTILKYLSISILFILLLIYILLLFILHIQIINARCETSKLWCIFINETYSRLIERFFQ